MADRVIDACVAVKWFLQEVDSAKAHAILQEANPESDRIHMLDVAVAEVMNAILKARRRQQITDDEVEIFLSASTRFP